MPTDDAYDSLLQRAREAGSDHGKNAASWYFDGNTPQEAYELTLRGIEEGDPAVLDTFPSAPLSGEWADDPTPASVLVDLTGRTDWDAALSDEAAEEILNAYEEGFYEASQDEIERVARYHTS